MVYEQCKFKQLTNNYPKLKIQLIEWFKANETICQLSNSEPKQTNNSYITHASTMKHSHHSIHTNLKETYVCANASHANYKPCKPCTSMWAQYVSTLA